MGYCSEVAIAFYGEHDAMVAFIAAARLDEKFKTIWEDCEMYPWVNRRQDHPSGRTVSVPMFMLAYHASCTKWYDEFPEVIAWRALMSAAQDKDDTICYEYVEIGEEIRDIHQEQSGEGAQWFLSVNTTIDKDLPDKQEKAA